MTRSMYCRILGAAFSFTVLTASPVTAFTLVKDGQPACSIILAEKPSEGAKIAAMELQTYVERISGAIIDLISRRKMALTGASSRATPGTQAPSIIWLRHTKTGWDKYPIDDTPRAAVSAAIPTSANGPQAMLSAGSPSARRCCASASRLGVAFALERVSRWGWRYAWTSLLGLKMV